MIVRSIQRWMSSWIVNTALPTPNEVETDMNNTPIVSALRVALRSTSRSDICPSIPSQE